VKGSSRSLFEVPYWHVPGETDENHGNPQSSQSPGLDCVPDRPLVRDPIKTLLEYPYELGVWDFDPVHILILIEV
jgi:hypothetical protein